MPVRTAQAEWQGTLKEGKGKMAFGGGAYEGAYSFSSRFEAGKGTNPEELIAASHAGCFSMALSARLGNAGFAPKSVKTTAKVHLEKVGEGFGITKIELDTVADVPGIKADAFQEHAEQAKKGCPVSRALSAVEIKLNARLVS
ncbi:MAG: OsmC family protein [Gemmatimonadetes bacterium]|nr:OsmC family protein [Gemmatimonadota bacterium]